jgi:hypothetical protein
MTFAPTITHTSQALPGVTFTVRRIGFSRGVEIDFATLALRQRQRELEADYPPFSDAEKEIAEALEIAQRKAYAVPMDQFDAVVDNEVKPLAAELNAAAPVEIKKRRAVIAEENRIVNARIRAQWIRSGLVAIAGGDVDGMTADQLLEYGPPALALEIYEAVSPDGHLQGPETKNFSSPITSGQVVGGESPNTIAPAADPLPAATT